MSDTKNPLHYALLFTGVYAVLLVVANAVVMAIGAEIGNALNAGILMGSVALIASKYAMNEKRKPERKEKLTISAFCLAGAMLVSVSIMAVIAVIDKVDIGAMFSQFSMGILAAAMIFTLVLYFAVIYFVFGWFVGMFLKQAAKAK